MATTYEPIATNTLGSAVATVTFSSIPATYTDLILQISDSQTSGAGQTTLLRFNGDSATNYSVTRLYGDGTTYGSDRTTAQTGVYGIEFNSATAQSMSTFNVMNYSNATTYKTTLVRTSTPSNGVASQVGLWRSTAAITSMSLVCGSTNTFNVGSTFTLYGIKAA
jgi:hypothetical protein